MKFIHFALKCREHFRVNWSMFCTHLPNPFLTVICTCLSFKLSIPKTRHYVTFTFPNSTLFKIDLQNKNKLSHSHPNTVVPSPLQARYGSAVSRLLCTVGRLTVKKCPEPQRRSRTTGASTQIKTEASVAVLPIPAPLA